MFNNGIDLHMSIMERLGEMKAVARSENLRCPIGGGWWVDLPTLPTKGRLHKVLHALTCACAGTA